MINGFFFHKQPRMVKNRAEVLFQKNHDKIKELKALELNRCYMFISNATTNSNISKQPHKHKI